MYTTSSAFLDALVEAKVSFIFANVGSDHPALIEAIAEARATGRAVPEVITCPNEMVGMSAAHGYWQASGAALGVKMARPDKTVVALTGDGSFMFTVPSSVHWMARRYAAPFLQVIFNNRGWKSPKLSTLAVYPHGYAAQANQIDTSFEPPPDYVGIAAAAGGAWGRQLRDPAEVDETLAEALHVVREERRCAVLDVWLDHH